MSIRNAPTANLRAAARHRRGAFAFGGVLAVFVLVAALSAQEKPETGTTYYVSPSGSDAAPGTSVSRAWKSIARVNRGSYRPGDKILFEAGKTFAGSIVFTPANTRGTAAPLTVGSYGQGRATIRSGKEHGLFAHNVGALHVVNLNLLGAVANSGAFGIATMNETSTALSDISIADVTIRGYTHAIFVGVGPAPARYRNLRVERVVAHDNGAGLSFFGRMHPGSAKSGGDYAMSDVYIGHSRAFNNTGFGATDLGYGIALMNAKDVTIEHTVVHDNGGDNLPPGAPPNGPSGILVYDGHKVTIQHNEVYHQRRDPDGPTDNAGIDLWATDSLVQFNYVHNNEGWGMILGAGDPANPNDPFPWPSERNTIRYNVFVNNARRLPSSRIPEQEGAQLLLFGPIKDFEIYNNTLYARNPAGPRPRVVKPEAMIGVSEAMISVVAVPPARLPEGIRLRNNIFVAEDRVRFIELPNLVVDARFERNAYIGGALANQVMWGQGTTFNTIAAWSRATGQERVRETFVGKLAASTALCAPHQGDARGLQLRPGSPLIDAGTDLRSHGLHVGTRDFFGNPIPSGGGFDIGAHEHRAEQGCR